MSQVSLDQLQIATPCPMSWDEMEGTDAVRFCSKCSLNVYNIAQMNREDAEDVIRNSEGRVCMRLSAAVTELSSRGIAPSEGEPCTARF